VHYTSHAELQINAATQVRAFQWFDIEVLRVHRGRFLEVDIIDRALTEYHLAYVPNHSAAHLTEIGSLADPKFENVNPEILQRGCTMRSVLFWRQEVANFPPEDDNVPFIFGSDDALRFHLRVETRDINFDEQGIYAKLLKQQGIQHRHRSSSTAACDQIAQDGNFDAKYRIKDNGEALCHVVFIVCFNISLHLFFCFV